MPTQHRDSTMVDTPEVELSSYPSSDPFPTSSSHPLLGGSGSSSSGVTRDLYPPDDGETTQERPISPSFRKRRKSPGFSSTLRRYWKPIVLLSSPFFFLFIYSLIHPHVPGLPPLPKVKVQLGDSAADTDIIGAGAVAVQDDCVCGHTDEGDRLCRIYRKEGLEASRLLKTTGSRLRRVLQKARDGAKVKVGVLGGSGEFNTGLLLVR
jgi:hypothetical protein